MNYEVTIGIPVFNIERYIRTMLESALAQTFPSIEFLICDDCGIDGSIDIVKEYQQTHPRGKDIRIIRQPQNMGIGSGRNRMMSEARGRYFYSLDGDDTISPQTIELLYNAAKNYQAELVYGSYERIYVKDGQQTGIEPVVLPNRVFMKPDEYACFAYGRVYTMNWNWLIDMDVIRRNHLKVTPVGHGYGEDFTFTIDLPTYVTRVVLLSDLTYQYYIRDKDNHQKRRKKLERSQLDIAFDTIEQKKRRHPLLRDKAYEATRCYYLMMYNYSFISEILSRKRSERPVYSAAELRNFMRHPMTLGEIIHSQTARGSNIFYWLLGKLTPSISILIMIFAVKMKRRERPACLF